MGKDPARRSEDEIQCRIGKNHVSAPKMSSGVVRTNYQCVSMDERDIDRQICEFDLGYRNVAESMVFVSLS